MTSSMSPYLNLRDQSAAALSFYQSVFGGETHVLTVGQGGALPADRPAAGLLMHGELRGEVVILQASDAPEGVVPFEVVHGNDLHLCLQSDDVAEGRSWFEALADGGEVRMPFAVQVWGDHYGQVTDRFCVQWMVNVHSADAEQAPARA